MSRTGVGSEGASWEELFDELVELPLAERASRLETLRGTSPALASRLEQLLAAEAAADGFLARPLAEVLSSAEEPALPPGSMLDEWRVVRLAGRGGMGEVYLAERADGSFSQQVAIKLVLRGGSARGIVRRFLRERQILAQLDHPNIARLLDGGTAPDGRPYFVLEWVDGEPITAWCESRSLPLEARLRQVRTVCEAVASAHRRLVVHRDLKPANILVSADGAVKLLDFGIAKLLDERPSEGSTLTRLEGRALTPAYAAPEQILGEPVTVACDVYALGVLLYELVTGELPHQRGERSLDALASTVDRETIERPSVALRRRENTEETGVTVLARQVAGDLDLIVLKALHRDPARRYRSAAALADDLGRFLDGRPVEARPDELGYRLRKFVGRHRWAVAAAAIGLGAIVLGLGVALWQAGEARAEARRADAASARAERVKSFLISVFRESDPDLARGEEVTARELLVRGAERLERELAAEPATRADLFEAIARIEDSLGLLDPALEHAQRALEIRGSLTERDEGRLALSELVVAEVRRDRGELVESRRLLEPLLPRLRAAYGDDSLEVAAAERQLASSMHRPEDLAWAEQLLRHALSILSAHPDMALEVADAETSLALALEQRQRYDEAETLFRRALLRMERRFGTRHHRVAGIQANLAEILDRLSRREEARPLFEAALATERATLGTRHERHAETLFSYGIFLLGAADYSGADAAFRESLSIFGGERFEAAHCLRYLGLSAANQERWSDAVTFYERAAAAYSRTVGDDDLQRHRALANLGGALLHLPGRAAEGRRRLESAAARIEVLVGPEGYELRLPLKQLGEAQTTTGETDAAVATLRRVRALEEKLFGTTAHREVAGSDLLLARALLARAGDGDRATARRTLDEALGILSGAREKDPLRAELLVESGRLARLEGDSTRARADLSAALAAFTARFGSQHPKTLEASRLLRRLGK